MFSPLGWVGGDTNCSVGERAATVQWPGIARAQSKYFRKNRKKARRADRVLQSLRIEGLIALVGGDRPVIVRRSTPLGPRAQRLRRRREMLLEPSTEGLTPWIAR